MFECRYVTTAAPPHDCCGAPTQSENHLEPYCPTHKAICHRGPGKDARSLEEMIYAVDQSQYRGRSPYADHTDPVDEELRPDRGQAVVKETPPPRPTDISAVRSNAVRTKENAIAGGWRSDFTDKGAA